jgi:choline kinase
VRYKLDIIIPAAGMGRRMKSVGPKALIPLNDDETVIARQLRMLRDEFPGSRVSVVAGFQADRLRKALPKDVRVLVNDDYEETNVATSLSIGLENTPADRPALVVYGDLVFNREALAGLRTDRSSVLAEDCSARPEEVGLNVVDGLVARFAHGLRVKWAHVAVLAPKEKGLFVHLSQGHSRRKFFTYEVLNDVIDAGGMLHVAYQPLMQLVEIDYVRDIDHARRLAA